MDETREILKAVLDRLEEIGADVKATKNRVENIETRLDNIETRLDNIERDVAELKQGQLRHEKCLSNSHSGISKI